MATHVQAPANEGLKNQLATAAAAQQAGLATQQAGKITTVAGWLTAPNTAEEIGRSLPAKADPKRWVRIILTETRKNPGLLEADYRSFALAVLQLAQLGLEPGPLGHSYLTGPFTSKGGVKEVVPILGYKGLMDLAYRAGTVDFIDAVVVRAGEPFRIVRGSEYRLEHEELASCAGHDVVAYYAIAFPKASSRAVFEVMWPDEVDEIRKRSRASKAGPWVTDFEAMALKSPIRRMVNRGKVRLSAAEAAAIAEDEAREFGYDRPEVVDASVFAVGAPPAGQSKPRAQAEPTDEGPPLAEADGTTAELRPEQAEGSTPAAPEAAKPAAKPAAAATAPEATAKGGPTTDPAAPGSILRDPQPEAAGTDPGAAFRAPKKEGK